MRASNVILKEEMYKEDFINNITDDFSDIDHFLTEKDISELKEEMMMEVE